MKEKFKNYFYTVEIFSLIASIAFGTFAVLEYLNLKDSESGIFLPILNTLFSLYFYICYAYRNDQYHRYLYGTYAIASQAIMTILMVIYLVYFKHEVYGLILLVFSVLYYYWAVEQWISYQKMLFIKNCGNTGNNPTCISQGYCDYCDYFKKLQKYYNVEIIDSHNFRCSQKSMFFIGTPSFIRKPIQFILNKLSMLPINLRLLVLKIKRLILKSKISRNDTKIAKNKEKINKYKS